MLADGCSQPFDKFMDWALYDPESGYYRQPSSRIFGRSGDFFTASQLQPAFGAVIASLLPQEPVLELGAGHGEMETAVAPRPYLAINIGDRLPAAWNGVIFANEFFDALPVVAGVRQGDELFELLVGRSDSTYSWKRGPPISRARRAYVRRYYPDLPDGARFEIAERALEWIRRLSECLLSGTVLIIDYGYSGREYLRFPEGSLMSYHRHNANNEVLANPGRQDITAHVPFDALIDCARRHGFAVAGFETLAQATLAAMERTPRLLPTEAQRPRLKTLLFGMGQSFRVLTLKKRFGQ